MLLLIIPILTTCLISSSMAGQTYQVSENIYSWTNYGAFVSMFIVTGDGVMVIEPVSSFHSTQLLQAIRNITDEPIKYLFYSHNHWDHASGGKVFKDVGATIVAHEDAYDWLKDNPGPETLLPDEKWSGSRKDFTVGGVTLELYHFGASHGLGMTAFLVPSAKVVYIADNVSPNSVGFTILPDFNIKEWERTLGEYMKLDFDTAIYSHSSNPEPVKGGDKEDIEEMQQYLIDVKEGIRAELLKGTNPFLIPSTLKLPKYQDWAFYDQWLEMNIWAIFLQETNGPFLNNRCPEPKTEAVESKNRDTFWTNFNLNSAVNMFYNMNPSGYVYHLNDAYINYGK